jgi:hypothetical protein
MGRTLQNRQLQTAPDFISEADSQIVSGSGSLPDPVVLETEEQMLERERNERDVLDALGEYKCDTGMSVEDVPAVVNKKTQKGQLITHKFNTGGCGEEWKRSVLMVSLKFAVKYRSIKHC